MHGIHDFSIQIAKNGRRNVFPVIPVKISIQFIEFYEHKGKKLNGKQDPMGNQKKTFQILFINYMVIAQNLIFFFLVPFAEKNKNFIKKKRKKK